jgi:hypothetical protein
MLWIYGAAAEAARRRRGAAARDGRTTPAARSDAWTTTPCVRLRA